MWLKTIPSSEYLSPGQWALTLLKVSQQVGSPETHSSQSFTTLSFVNLFPFLRSDLQPSQPWSHPTHLPGTWAPVPTGDRAGGEAVDREMPITQTHHRPVRSPEDKQELGNMDPVSYSESRATHQPNSDCRPSALPDGAWLQNPSGKGIPSWGSMTATLPAPPPLPDCKSLTAVSQSLKQSSKGAQGESLKGPALNFPIGTCVKLRGCPHLRGCPFRARLDRVDSVMSPHCNWIRCPTNLGSLQTEA